MRVVKSKNPQMKLGEIDIGRIEFDLRCRDEIPKMLIGFQHIYTTPELREEIFKVLENLIPQNIDKNNGRPGMQLWQILVMGSLRLNCNWDYDKLQDIVNNHSTVRQMLGISTLEDHIKFHLNTLKDNVSLLTPEILREINDILVKHSHAEIVKKNSPVIKGHCDSFVVKTNVHYPTDVNLLNDAMRKVISLAQELCSLKGLTGWRQWRHLIKLIKNAMYHIQNVNRKSKGGKNKDRKNKEKKRAYKSYIGLCEPILVRAKADIEILSKKKLKKSEQKTLLLLKDFIKDAERQIDQISRRIFKEETILSSEKVFSIFERHTEWIVKGKAGISQELGVKVCILKDQYGFILNHKVMEKLEDVDVAIPFVKETKNIFRNLTSCSFDKGFYSPKNREELNAILDTVIMPKKGKLNSSEQTIETSEEFISARKKHSAVESAIAALENHGLDLCPDKKITGFKRYIALAVFSRNVQILGHIIQQKRLREALRKERKNRLSYFAA